MATAQRILLVSFADADAFATEYYSNLVNGGVFVASDEPFELREQVGVDLVLEMCSKSVTLTGEVVHVLTPEMAQMGAAAGVAVQFDGAVAAVRGKLEPLRLAAGVTEGKKGYSGDRRSPRTDARVPAEIDGSNGPVTGVTSNLSQNGVLVSVAGEGLSVGEIVRLALRHPHTKESMDIAGMIVRREETDGGMSAVAIDFAPHKGESGELSDFVASIQATEHARRLGGIVGDIADLGVQNVMQMFATIGREGTLTMRHLDLEGVLGFEKGLLRFCRVGSIGGMKALVRLLGWKSGTFEFHSSQEPVQASGEPRPFEAALLEALTMMDESEYAGRATFDLDAEPQIVTDSLDSELTKTEAAVIDLVRAGFSVRRMIAVIPEPDPEIQRALASLHDRGAIAV